MIGAVTTSPLIWVLMGAAGGAGIWLIVSGVRRQPPRPPHAKEPFGDRWARLTRRPRGRAGAIRDIRWVGTVVLAIVITAATGLVAALLIVPLATLVVPSLLANPAKRDLERLDALETWVRSLGSLLQGGSDNTVEGVLRTSSQTAPQSLRPELTNLIARLEARMPADQALERFANDLADPVGDTIVAALILAVRRRGMGLSDVLDGLAEAVSDEVRARRRIESERSSARASAKYVTILAAGMAAGLAVFNPSFLQPYTTGLGEVLLVFIVAAYLGALWLLRRITSPPPIPRIHPTATAVSEARHVV